MIDTSDKPRVRELLREFDEFTLICGMKFLWCRLPNNEIIGWDVYLEFRRKEEVAGYPKDAFLTIMPKCLSSSSHASIVYDFLDLLISIASNSQYNHLNGRKVAKMASMWAFKSNQSTTSSSAFYDATAPQENSFLDGLSAWRLTCSGLFHLLLAFLRAMLPDTEAETLNLPKTLQSLLISNSYPPPETSNSLKSVITIPCVHIRSTRRSADPYSLISKVRNTLTFDKKDLFLSIENYTILKNIFQKPSTAEIVSTLTEDSRRVLNRLSAEPVDSDFNLFPGWARSHREEQDPNIPLFSEVTISSVTLQDYFIWTWLSSLGSDQSTRTKSLFGRSIVVEAGLRGFQKWMVLTETTIPPDEYVAMMSLPPQQHLSPHKSPSPNPQQHLRSQLKTKTKYDDLPPPPPPTKNEPRSPSQKDLLPELQFETEPPLFDQDGNIVGHSGEAHSKFISGVNSEDGLVNDFRNKAIISPAKKSRRPRPPPLELHDSNCSPRLAAKLEHTAHHNITYELPPTQNKEFNRPQNENYNEPYDNYQTPFDQEPLPVSLEPYDNYLVPESKNNVQKIQPTQGGLQLALPQDHNRNYPRDHTAGVNQSVSSARGSPTHLHVSPNKSNMLLGSSPYPIHENVNTSPQMYGDLADLNSNNFHDPATHGPNKNYGGDYVQDMNISNGYTDVYHESQPIHYSNVSEDKSKKKKKKKKKTKKTELDYMMEHIPDGPPPALPMDEVAIDSGSPMASLSAPALNSVYPPFPQDTNVTSASSNHDAHSALDGDLKYQTRHDTSNGASMASHMPSKQHVHLIPGPVNQSNEMQTYTPMLQTKKLPSERRLPPQGDVEQGVNYAAMRNIGPAHPQQANYSGFHPQTQGEQYPSRSRGQQVQEQQGQGQQGEGTFHNGPSVGQTHQGHSNERPHYVQAPNAHAPQHVQAAYAQQPHQVQATNAQAPHLAQPQGHHVTSQPYQAQLHQAHHHQGQPNRQAPHSTSVDRVQQPPQTYEPQQPMNGPTQQMAPAHPQPQLNTQPNAPLNAPPNQAAFTGHPAPMPQYYYPPPPQGYFPPPQGYGYPPQPMYYPPPQNGGYYPPPQPQQNAARKPTTSELTMMGMPTANLHKKNGKPNRAGMRAALTQGGFGI